MRKRGRKYPKILEVIGEHYMKVPELNKRAFVCLDNEDTERYIEGLSEVASPPLSVPGSAKPSAVKQLQTSNSVVVADGKRSCREEAPNKEGVIEYQHQIKPMTTRKTSVERTSTFMNPLPENENQQLIDRCKEFTSYKAQRDAWDKLPYNDRLAINLHGNWNNYYKWTINRVLRPRKREVPASIRGKMNKSQV